MREIFKSRIFWIASIGYFVDLFDLVLFGAVRVDSLKSLGYQGSDLFSVGLSLVNIQMVGMVVGGVLWGTLGDKRGRKEALFGSILLYSLATFLNGFVHDFAGYATLRFLAGVGLAGELGAAVTLISEVLPQGLRGLGTAFLSTIGFLGAISATLVAKQLSWENAYRLGGALGIIVLLFRLSVNESPMFLGLKRSEQKASWGSLSLVIHSPRLLKLSFLAFVAGVPIWYVAGILSYFAPEFAKAQNVVGSVTAGDAIMVGYMGAILGDIACGVLSQKLKSRKKAVFLFALIGGMLAVGGPYLFTETSSRLFYCLRFGIGFGCGYTALLVAWIAEIFGTNLRVTQSSILSNLIRAAVIPLTFSFQTLMPHLGLLTSSTYIGGFCFLFALLAISRLPETFSRDLRFIETFPLHLN